MALLAANASRLVCLNRTFSGVATVAGGHRRENIGSAGRNNWFSGDHSITEVTDKSGAPNGYRHPGAWLLPRKGGAIASYRRGVVSVTGAASGALGVNIVADGSVSLVGSAIGGLIAGGVATGTVTIDGTVVMFAALGAAGTGLVTVGGTASVSAIGYVVASGTIEVNGTVTPFGLGWMDGTSDFGTELTPANLAAAVWNALDAANDVAGTMGAKLNDAGSASNPWTEILEAGYTAAELLKILVAVAAGKTVIIDNGGGSATVTFRNVSDTKDAVVADMQGSERETITLDP